jgi:hypothetical protein
MANEKYYDNKLDKTGKSAGKWPVIEPIRPIDLIATSNNGNTP